MVCLFAEYILQCNEKTSQKGKDAQLVTIKRPKDLPLVQNNLANINITHPFLQWVLKWVCGLQIWIQIFWGFAKRFSEFAKEFYEICDCNFLNLAIVFLIIAINNSTIHILFFLFCNN